MRINVLIYLFLLYTIPAWAGSGSGTGTGTGSGTGTGTGSGSGSGKTNTSSISSIASKVGMNQESFKKWVDTDHDGKVSQQEIMGAIDKYFDGNPNCDVNGIMQLIDGFFEEK